MALRPDQFEPFLKALLDAFPDQASLEIWLRLRMGIHLSHLAEPGTLQTQVFHLIREMDAQGRVAEFARSAHEYRPNNDALREAVEAVLDPGQRLGLVVHNWIRDEFAIRASAELDWTPHFDRPSGRVPSVDTWHEELLPDLQAARRQFLQAQAPRTIRFRGRCCLSAGFAVGTTFPSTAWHLEVEQNNHRWHSLDEAGGPAPIIREEVVLPGAGSLALIINATGDARHQVNHFLKDSGLRVDAIITAQSEERPSQRSVQGGGHAALFASTVKSHLAEAKSRHDVACTHLFCYAPLGLAAFLGHYMSRVGAVQCYEPQGNSYVRSCRLDT